MRALTVKQCVREKIHTGLALRSSASSQVPLLHAEEPNTAPTFMSSMASESSRLKSVKASIKGVALERLLLTMTTARQTSDINAICQIDCTHGI